MTKTPVLFSAVALVVSAFVFAGAGVLSAQQDAEPRLPRGVAVQRNIAYVPGGHERQKLDLYLPENTSTSPLAKDGKLPLIIWVHGGGWYKGSKSGCYPLAWKFAERGYAIASIGYRLSGTEKFPAQIEDCKAAVRWLRANAAKHDIDPDRFIAWGRSAGGHLAALMGTTNHTRIFDKGPNSDASSAVQVVVDYFGPADFSADDVSGAGGTQYKAVTDVINKLLGVSPMKDPAKAAAASPITYVAKNSPPIFIVHGSKDRTVPVSQSQVFHEALKKAGADAKLKIIDGAGHGGGAFATREVLDEVDAFIKTHLDTSR